jgi:hypothetical protein
LKDECGLNVFENRVLRGIFGPKRDEVTREWRRLHNEELHALHSLSNLVWVIKSRMGLAGHVAGMGERRGDWKILVGSPETRKHFEDSGVNRRIILKWTSEMLDGGMDWIDLVEEGTGGRLL